MCQSHKYICTENLLYTYFLLKKICQKQKEINTVIGFINVPVTVELVTISMMVGLVLYVGCYIATVVTTVSESIIA